MNRGTPSPLGRLLKITVCMALMLITMQAKSFAGLVINQSSDQKYIGPETSQIDYTLSVSNNGETSLTSVQVQAPGCENIQFRDGDNGNGQLDPNETWTYTATDSAFAYAPGSTLSCTASATANAAGEIISATSHNSLPIIGFNLEKQASIEKGCVGDEVEFTLITRLYAPPNSGITMELVDLVDDTCSPLVTTSGDTNEFGRLALPPGENVAELFNVCTLVLSESVTNIATETIRFYDGQGEPDNRLFMETDSVSVIVDTTAPEITACPPAFTVDADESKEPTSTPTATDDCDPAPTSTYTDAPPTGECPMTIERTWIVSDNCGNTNTCTQIITMNCAFDFGDAPDDNTAVQAGTPNGYPTSLVDDGARHTISSTLLLGTLVDEENDGTPDPISDGDDNDNSDDEDGISFSNLDPGGDGTATVTVTGEDGLLNAWFDFNRDGDWDDPGEQIATDLPVSSGINVIMFAIPPDADPGPTFTRFRLSTTSGLSPTGAAPDGEVEDYVTTIRTPNAVITALVYCDHNDDGIIEQDALLSSGVTVQLLRDGEIIDETTTDGDGLVSFGNVPLGDYTVVVVDGDGTPLEGKIIAPTNYSNPLNVTVDDPTGSFEATFGYMSAMAPPLSIDGFIWQDDDGNDLPNEMLNDLIYNGITVKLIQNDVVVATVDTDFEPGTTNTGYFIFPDLEPGNYTIMATFLNPGNMRTVSLIFDCMGERVLFPINGQITAVQLSSFTGESKIEGVQLNWTTGVEDQNLGFFMYRSTENNFDTAEQIGSFIEGSGNASDVDYSYLDETAAPRTLYFYWLVDVDWDLNMTSHGPVEVYHAPYTLPAFELCGIRLRNILRAGFKIKRGERVDVLINGAPTNWRIFKPRGRILGILFDAPVGISYELSITAGNREYVMPQNTIVHIR